MKLPIISQKQHKQKIKEKDSQIYFLKQEIRKLEEDLVTATRIIDKILPRLARLQEPILDEEFGTYRVCAEFQRDMVIQCFIHGGDERMIRFIAERLGREIERKMVQSNFVRYNKTTTKEKRNEESNFNSTNR